MAVYMLYDLCIDKVSKCVAKAKDLEALTIPVTVRKDLLNYKANTNQIEEYLYKLNRKIENTKKIRSNSKTILHILRYANKQNSYAFRQANYIISAISEFIDSENNSLMKFRKMLLFDTWNAEGLRRFSEGLQDLLTDVSEIHEHFKTEKNLLNLLYEEIEPEIVIYTIPSELV